MEFFNNRNNDNIEKDEYIVKKDENDNTQKNETVKDENLKIKKKTKIQKKKEESSFEKIYC